MYSNNILKINIFTLLILLVILLIMFVAVGCNKPQEPVLDPEDNNIDDLEDFENSQLLIEPVVCPLCGELVEKRLIEGKRPIAVMIDNHPSARPQSGLNEADLVYEIPFEGGITRFFAVYLHNDDATEIGPVRSARHNCLDLVLEYNAIYVYYGGSPQAWDQIEKLKIEGMNGIYDCVTFYRYPGRKEPHDKYTNIERINITARNKGFDKKTGKRKFSFNEEDMVPNGESAEFISIKYPVKYTVMYKYDPTAGNYLRNINEEPHLDAVSETQIRTKNIIIQFVNFKVIDSEGRLDIMMVGKGKGFYISNGSITEIKWEKDSRSSATRFIGKDDKEINLNPGKTWIHLVSSNTKVSYE